MELASWAGSRGGSRRAQAVRALPDPKPRTLMAVAGRCRESRFRNAPPMVSRVTRLTGAEVGQFRRSPGTELPNPEPREPAQLRRDWAEMCAVPRRVLATSAHWGIG